MKNNRGSVLVIFVCLLPVILFFLVLTVDIGFKHIEKRKIENSIKYVIRYGFTVEEEDNLEWMLEDLLQKNIEDMREYYVHVSENRIQVTLKKRLVGVLGKEKTDLEMHYVGYMEHDKVLIEKE